MPSIYGDYYGLANDRGGDNDPAFLHSVSKVQYALLHAWKNGDFVEDWGQAPASQPTVTPEGLDRAALENMSGGAFFPGMEASWLFTKKEVWDRPFRVARNKVVGTIPVPGENRRDLLLEAGAFSQQMALPWQADFLDCSAPASDDDTSINDGGWVTDSSVAGKRRRVAWWPTNRPDEVFPFDAPRDRRPWARVPDAQQPLGYREMQEHVEMVDLWSTLGFIVEMTPDGAAKDLYEVEFNKAPLAAPQIAAVALEPAAAKKKTTKKKAAKTKKPSQQRSKA